MFIDMAKTFRELRVYTLATEISDSVWALRELLKPASPAIWYQLDKSGGSIEDNIAEGFGRESRADFANFLRYSRGSAMEAEAQVSRALRRRLIPEQDAAEIIRKCQAICTMLRNLQASLRRDSASTPHTTLHDPEVAYGTSNPTEDLNLPSDSFHDNP